MSAWMTLYKKEWNLRVAAEARVVGLEAELEITREALRVATTPDVQSYTSGGEDLRDVVATGTTCTENVLGAEDVDP